MHAVRQPRSASSLGLLAACWLIGVAGCASLRSGVTGTPASAEVDVPTAVQRVEAARDQGQCDQAIAQWKAGRAAEARQLLDQVLARNPRYPLARRLKADLALTEGREPEAEELLTALLQEDPNDRAAAASLACLYESQGRLEAAQPLFARLEADEAAP